MKGTLIQNGKAIGASQQGIEQALAEGAFFWLDLDIHDPGPDDDVTGLLTNTFHFHPLAVEAADRFGQRARIDDYGDFVHVITFGMASDGKNVAEVHCFITGKVIISIHQGNCPALATVHERIRNHHSSKVAAPQIVIFYLIMDTLVDSFFHVLSDFDDSIDDIERASLNNDMVTIPGLTDQGSAYFRNLYDHLIRISDMVDAYRDLIGGAMDTHLSMVSNRLNVVMKQLAVIATVFLPLGFLTGFFGQNFAWPITHIQNGLGDFLFLGIGSELVAIILLVILFRRRGWLGSGPTA